MVPGRRRRGLDRDARGVVEGAAHPVPAPPLRHVETALRLVRAVREGLGGFRRGVVEAAALGFRVYGLGFRV